MTVIQLDSVTKSFGGDLLFAPFSAQIGAGDRIALIGDNGTGKSTLLRIIAGLERPSDGVVRPIGDVRVGYLPQTARLHDEGTLRQAMERPFAELRWIEQELRRIEAAIAEGASDPSIGRYDELLHRYEHRGGYEIDAKIRTVLAGVGFRPDEFDRPVEHLSGGEEARAALARVLVEAPDLLLLDEPTNHLDFEALDWLEESLLSFPGALILVSHDRHLLDRVANRTWEISFREVTLYRVGYSASRELREEERRRRLDLFEDQEEKIDRYKDFIRRHKAGQKHRQAKDRERKLERIEQERIEAPKDAKRITFRIAVPSSSGRIVLRTRGLAVGYDRPLFACPDIELVRGEKVAVIGENGCGKTTLLRTITGERAPLSGACELGHGVRVAVYSQTQEGLHDDRTVLDAVLSRTQLTISEARGLLGRFLFSGPDVEKKTKSLSGGERSRVALALLSLMDGNLLLLDEPTNHLDLASQEILEQALVDYDGTILLVSHDRTLLERVTTQVWRVEGSRMIVRPYGYAEERRRQREQAAERAAAPSPSEKPRPSAPARTERPNRERAQKERAEIEAIERAVEELERRKEQIEHELVAASTDGDPARISSLSAEHKAIQSELAQSYAEWEAAASRIETAS